MLKKSVFTKRNSYFFFSVLLVSLCATGVLVQRSFFSSRVVLKDELKVHRKLLHSAETEHACDCFSPFVSGFQVSNITENSAAIKWNCDVASTYQVRYGTSSSKSSTYPASRPSSTYKSYTVTLSNLQPQTLYHVGPRSVCLSGCTRNDQYGLVRTYDVNGKSDWTFTTLGPTTYTISGSIRTDQNVGITGVTVTLSGAKNATVTTTSTGAYSFADLSTGNYTVTPTKTGYNFDPPFTTFSSLAANQSSKNFSGSPATAILDKGVETARTMIIETSVADITADDVTITWKTNNPSTSLIEYGLTTAYGQKSEVNPTMGLDHVIQLFDLKNGATYHARAVSIDAATGNEVYSKDFTFTTPSRETRVIDPMAVFNEPNPCFNRTMFVYYLYQPVKRMTIDIVTLTGKTVASLEAPQSTLNVGYNRVMWDLRDNSQRRIANGVYVYKMKFYLENNQVIEVSKSNLMVRR